MIFQDKHLEKALNDLETAYEGLPGEDYEYEDLTISLQIVERALAEALRTKPDLLILVDPTDIESEDDRIKAHLGRLLFVRAILLYDLRHYEFAARSARLACQAFRDTLAFEFDDEDRYVANHLHKLMMSDVASVAFRDDEIADSYEKLFDYYVQLQLLDRAEDMLFHALDLAGDPIHLLEKGIEFYDHLREQSRRFLQKRGLPLREVNESRRELEERFQAARIR